MRLSLAIRFFAGADPYDLMITHGVSYISVFYAVWGVVDVINNIPHFNITFFCNRFEMDFSVSGFKPENMVSKSLKCVVVFSSSAASLLT